MTKDEAIKILKENLLILQDALYWLNRSYGKCRELDGKEMFSDEEFDIMETLASRFARVTDITFQKVFRSIDQVELEDTGTLLDAANRGLQKEFL